jgi:hypothetical protein
LLGCCEVSLVDELEESVGFVDLVKSFVILCYGEGNAGQSSVIQVAIRKSDKWNLIIVGHF